MKAREQKLIVVTVSQEHGFQDSVFPEVNSAFERAHPAYVSRLYCGFTAYFPSQRSALARVEAVIRQLEDLKIKVAPSPDLRVGLSCGPVLVEPGWFGTIKNIVMLGPTLQEAVECEKTAGLYKSKLEALRQGVQQTD